MDEVLQEFLVESVEMLDQMEREMVAFEAGRAGPDAIRTIFRAIHTIKGTCGFLGMQRLQSLTHSGENLLSELRDEKLQVTPEITSALLSLVDAVRRTLAVIEATGAEGDVEYSGLISRLDSLLEPQAAAPAPAPISTIEKAPVASLAAPAAAQIQAAAPAPAPVAAPRETPPAVAVHAEPALIAQTPVAPAAAPAAIAPAPAHPEAPAPAADEHAEGPSSANSTVRVGVTLLDKLMTLVGELVLVRNQMLQHTARLADNSFGATSQRLNLLTTELQEGVMKARMQPIGNLFSKLPRVVRDLAHETGKKARVELSGVETELDRTILEAIKDPMTHLVRNAVDHGLESPADREKRGKPAEGRLTLRASHEGGQVHIEISDDGRGIDLERVRKKGIERGLITPERAARADERELIGLLFLPGFSTAEKITSVSGRGVGLDVVRTNVEKIGGALEVNSVFGQGTTFKIRIPLTLAIIPALVVRSGSERYAIPQTSLVEVVGVAGEKLRKGIEQLHDAPVYRLRGNLLPLVDLHKLLQDGGAANGESTPSKMSIAVLQSDRHKVGLIVDEIEDTQEIVVKPLEQGLKSISLFAGSTIMGDGRIALILDVGGIAQRSQASRSARAEEAAAPAAQKDLHKLLLLESTDRGRLAVELSRVARLEEIEANKVERAGHTEVVQYRGQILPLLRVASLLPERRTKSRLAKDAARRGGALPSSADGKLLQVVVHRTERGDVGLVVERIVDVVEEALDVRRPASRAGVLFSSVIDGRVTEMLDIDAIVRAADPFAAEQLAAVGS